MIRDDFSVDDNAIVVGVVQVVRNGGWPRDDAPRDGTWRIGLFIPNVAFGERYSTLSGRAVVDDFGALVVVGSVR